MNSKRAWRSSKWRREGPQASSSPTTPNPGSFAPQREREYAKMKAIVMLAAVLTSAMLTVPTVSQAADAKVSELRLNA